ncbi:MAG: helicase-associated domain-containing protein [Ktedonobacterales bacterium]
MKRSEATVAPGLVEAILFQRDLYLYWRLARLVGGLPLTTRGLVSRPLVRRLRAELAAAPQQGDPGEVDDLRLFFLRRLLERLGLLRRVAEEQRGRRTDGATDTVDANAGAAATSVKARLLAADEREMARYLAHPLAERLRICARLWMAGGWWPDSPGAAELPTPLAPAPPRIAIARRQLIESLLALTPGDLTSAPENGHPRAGALHIRSRGAHQRRGAATASHSSSQRSTGRVNILAEDETQRAALLGPLTWMGFVALADGNPADETRRVGLPLAALRRQPTPVAQAQAQAEVGDDEEVAALVEQHGRIVAQANLTLIAYPPLTAPALHTLDSCAERDALDQTARYRLTRTALVAARNNQQWQTADVVARLEGLTGTTLPTNVRITLGDWERHVERLRLTPNVTIVTVEDAAILDALLADRATAAWVERRLAPTIVLLTHDALPHARRWLLKHGRLPASVRHDT